MTSGTVTKNPVMKLRRSHWHQHHTHRATPAMTRREREPVIREHVERVRPPDTAEILDGQIPDDADTTMPTSEQLIVARRIGASASASFKPLLRGRRGDGRHAEQEAERAAASRRRPQEQRRRRSSRPTATRPGPARRPARRRWRTPRRSERVSASARRARPTRSAASMSDGADGQGDRDDGRRRESRPR